MRTIVATSRRVAVSTTILVLLSFAVGRNAHACPEGMVCQQGKSCPPVENCVSVGDGPDEKEPRAHRPKKKPELLLPPTIHSAPPPEPVPVPLSSQTQPSTVDLDSQIDRLGDLITRTRDKDDTRTREQDDDGDDPRDTGPPVFYGEEIDNEDRVGIALKRGRDSWIPRYGNGTFVKAKLYLPDPQREGVWLPSDSVRRNITVKFIARSNEEGKCLNARLDSEPQDSPDVYFPQDDNLSSECKDDPIGKDYFRSCTTIDPQNEQVFWIQSEDFGSFSKLDASCEDCVPLMPVIGVYPEAFNRTGWTVAVEEYDQEKRAVRVPKDVNDNQVSDGYVPDQIESKTAEDDSDSEPTGNGVAGDGLSIYEEYRGFIAAGGTHKRTDWDVKTLIVENRHQLNVYSFGARSELEVVPVDDGMLEDRIANFNSGHANVVDQHGVILQVEPMESGTAGACFSCTGRPKTVDRVGIDPKYAFAWDTIAHELGHAVGMDHHGDGDSKTELQEIRPAANFFADLLPGLLHPGAKLCGKTLPAKFRVGEKGAQGSGLATGLMRYQRAGYVYEQAGGSFDCMPYVSRNEFCTSPAGTGPNAGGRTAGNASLGNCKSRIWISSE